MDISEIESPIVEIQELKIKVKFKKNQFLKYQKGKTSVLRKEKFLKIIQ